MSSDSWGLSGFGPHPAATSTARFIRGLRTDAFASHQRLKPQVENGQLKPSAWVFSYIDTRVFSTSSCDRLAEKPQTEVTRTSFSEKMRWDCRCMSASKCNVVGIKRGYSAFDARVQHMDVANPDSIHPPRRHGIEKIRYLCTQPTFLTNNSPLTCAQRSVLLTVPRVIKGLSTRRRPRSHSESLKSTSARWGGSVRGSTAARLSYQLYCIVSSPGVPCFIVGNINPQSAAGLATSTDDFSSRSPPKCRPSRR